MRLAENIRFFFMFVNPTSGFFRMNKKGVACLIIKCYGRSVHIMGVIMQFFHSIFGHKKKKVKDEEKLIPFHSLAKREIIYFFVYERFSYDEKGQLEPIRQALERGIKCKFILAHDFPISAELIALMSFHKQQIEVYLIRDDLYLQNRRGRRHGRDIIIIDDDFIRYYYPRHRGKGWWKHSSVILNDVPNTIFEQRRCIERVIRLNAKPISVDELSLVISS